jgi:hypothetical protein
MSRAKLTKVVMSAMLSGCCTYISKQRAIEIANAEIGLLHIKLPRNCAVEIVATEFIPEFAPSVPEYIVSFSDPHRKSQFHCIEWKLIDVLAKQALSILLS